MNWKMKKFNIKTSGLWIVAFVVIISCNKTNNDSRVDVLPYYNEASFTPHWLQPNSKKLKEFHKVSDFNLLNQNGETVTQAELEDKIYVTDFFFTTCPGICPKMTNNMAVLQDTFLTDESVVFLSHSVMPSVDSVETLKTYAEDKGVISGKWHLLTGDKSEIYNLGRNVYFVEEDLGVDKSEDDFLHTENFVLVDKNKHIRGIYNGLNKTSIQQLIADIRTLQKE